MEDHVCFQSLLDMVINFHVYGFIQIAQAQQSLHLKYAFLGQSNGAVFFIDGVVARGPFLPRLLAFDHLASNQLRNNAIDLVILIGRFLAWAGDDQRRARFVDKNGVDFIDNSEVVAALDAVADAKLHVVAQIVEAVLVVGAVGDVAVVAVAAFIIVQVVNNNSDRKAQGLINAAHPFRVALGQIVVDGHHMDSQA